MTTAAAAPAVVSPALTAVFRAAWDFAKQQVRAVVERHPGHYPMYTVGGRWGAETERWTHWCEGFFPSMMWMFHAEDGDAFWRRKAEEYTVPLEPRKADRSVHDLGFLFLNTYDRWFRITGEPHLREVVLQAGRTLAGRFQPAGEYLCSFLGPRSLFVDIMMNVPLLLRAAELTGDNGLADLARRHCLTSRKVLVRPDGGTVHEALFDAGAGEFRESTQQGFAASSCWSRGLAWALYGFTTVFQQTRDPRFRETAQCCAEYYLRHAEADMTAPWDFDCPQGPQRIPDSSAAAITASGLWSLAQSADAPERSERYRSAALTILESLCGPRYLARGVAGQEGVLLHGVYHIHKTLGVDESLVFGDHFFVEALGKALGKVG